MRKVSVFFTSCLIEKGNGCFPIFVRFQHVAARWNHCPSIYTKLDASCLDVDRKLVCGIFEGNKTSKRLSSYQLMAWDDNKYLKTTTHQRDHLRTNLWDKMITILNRYEGTSLLVHFVYIDNIKWYSYILDKLPTSIIDEI